MNLLEYTKNVTSQRGEDGIIEKIFEVIGTTNRICIEFGAGKGERSSNTWNLLNLCGWGGVLIEPKEESFQYLTNKYKNRSDIVVLRDLIGFEEDDCLDNILKARIDNFPAEFDFLSIDIDGCDYHVWEAIKIHKPRVVMIEHNYTVPIDVEFVQPKDFEVYQGSSLKALYNLGRRKGYELVSATELNAVFVRREYFYLFDIEDNSPEALNPVDESEKMRLFQGYDGTLFLVGDNRLVWKNRQISHEDIQVLPPEERFYDGRLRRIVRNEE
jgi:hypothetical protein